MTNQDKAIYALLADNVYWDVRKGGVEVEEQENSNWTPVPEGWTVIDEVSGSGEMGKASNPELEGFTARAYQNGDNIIIAYAGTDPTDLKGDWWNNSAMGIGGRSNQAEQAALFYHKVKSENTDADIAFSGHISKQIDTIMTMS